MVATSSPIEIFCSYAHEDESWLRKLETHLSPLKRQGLISLWYDRLIVPGADWTKSIDTHLETSSVILLLVSADFLASDYCYGVEMQRALERESAGEARVVPILVRPVDWKGTPFAHLQALPTDARPISSWLDDDQALADVAAGIRRVIEDLPLLAASAPRTNLPAIWNVPYQPNPFFLGRDEELAQLRSRLQAGRATAISQPQAISGLGGIGKTQLALEYAYRYHQDYQAVLWAGAENADTLIASYIAIATLLRLPEREAKEQNIIVQAVKTWLQTHRSWLLILDNADELNLLSGFLPPSPGGHVLLTTRAAATGPLAYRMEIETLPPERGALFLLRRAALLVPDATLERASQEERALALQVSQGLGGLPLALDQAGAYLEETRTDLSSYWQIYQRHRADLLRERRGLGANHPAPVATTWSLSFERVQEKNPAAADLLRLCAFLAPDAIPEEVLTADTSLLGPLLAPVTTDAFLLDQAIEALRAYSLVQRNPNPKEKSLSVHRLVQAVLQDALEEAQRRMWAERAVWAINLAFPKVDDRWRRYDTWSLCQRYLPHVQICSALIEEWNMHFPEAAELLMRAGDYLAQRGRYTQAEPLYQRALEVRERVPDPEHRDTAETLRSLAVLYGDWDKYEQAEPLFQRALAIYEQMLGPDQPDIIPILRGLAFLYRDQGKHEQAEPLMQRALTLSEQVLGPEHPSTATALNHLAWLYRRQGKYEQAEILFQRALAIYERVTDPDQLDIVNILHGLALLYQYQGKYEQAEPLMRRALEISEQVLGPGHPEVATRLAVLAGLYQDQGKYEQAEPLYQRALEISEQVLGPDQPYTATTLSNLARLYQHQGKYAEAEPLYQQALTIYERALGPEHDSTAATLSDLAFLYQHQGKYEQAERLYQRALKVRERVLGPEHRITATTLHNLAILYQHQGKYAEAEPLYQRALAIYEQVLSPEHPRIAATLSDLADLYREQDNYAEAEPLYQRALKIREKVLGPEHNTTTATLSDLAFLYWDQGKYEQAEPLLERALTIREKVLGPEHNTTTATLSDLAFLYWDQGKYPQAEPLYQRALAIHEKALGSEHPEVANDLNNLADLYREQGKYAEAEPLYQRALHIWEQQWGAEHLDAAYPLSGLASLYYQQDKFVEAEQFFQRALRIREASAPEHPETAETLYGLAQLQEALSNSEEARTLYTRALAVQEQALGVQHPETTETRTRLIALLHALGQHEEAARLEEAPSES